MTKWSLPCSSTSLYKAYSKYLDAPPPNFRPHLQVITIKTALLAWDVGQNTDTWRETQIILSLAGSQNLCQTITKKLALRRSLYVTAEALGFVLTKQVGDFLLRVHKRTDHLWNWNNLTWSSKIVTSIPSFPCGALKKSVAKLVPQWNFLEIRFHFVKVEPVFP